jgi:protein-L-isoaspartate(D-aspartate) O-methyltransferase
MDYTAARLNMVESQVRPNDVTDVGIQHAMAAIARERFVAPERRALAYSDRAVEYVTGRALLPPRDVAKLLHAARPKGGETALAIAAPYAAVVLARMGLSVSALEPGGAGDIAAMLEAEGVSIVGGDTGQPSGSYDVIVCESAVQSAPEAWVGALKPGGRLAVVLRTGPVGKATVFLRTEAAVSAREAFDSTPAWLPGFEPKAAFVF